MLWITSHTHLGSGIWQVGVDVNLAAQTPWLAHQLQFVAGLGPRKAAAVLKAIQRQEQVASRRAVWKELKAIGKKVFWSVANADFTCHVNCCNVSHVLEVSLLPDAVSA